MTNLSSHHSLSENSEIRAVALQLQKDFMMYGEDIDVEQVTTLEELKGLLITEISDLMQRNKSKLTQIIYRIDVPEKAISGVLSSESTEGFEEGISRLMIERTQLKIQIKKQNS